MELPLDTLPRQVFGIAAALPVIAFACFVAVPVNPVATLCRMVTAVQARAARVLQAARAQAASARLQHELVRLNEAALAADNQLALTHPDGRKALHAGLVDMELAAARLAVALQIRLSTTPAPSSARPSAPSCTRFGCAGDAATPWRTACRTPSCRAMPCWDGSTPFTV